MSSCRVTSLLFVKTQPGWIQRIGQSGISYGVYRRSVGDYGGCYEDKPLLKDIWLNDLDKPRIDSNAESDAFEYSEFEFNSVSESTEEYEDFENNFTDLGENKKLPCWARTRKIRRRKLKREMWDNQKLKSITLD